MDETGYVTIEKRDPYLEAKQQIADLRQALAHQRQLVEHERRRALIAEASRDRAWQIAASFRRACEE